MRVVWCFVEKQENALKDFIAEHDAEYEIHIITPVAESCENNLLYCLGELTNLYVNAAEKTGFVTDVEEVYKYVQELYSDYFDEILYLEQGNARLFDPQLDWKELLRFEASVLLDKQGVEAVEELFAFNWISDIVRMWNFVIDVHNVIERVGEQARIYWARAAKVILWHLPETERSAFFEIMLYSILMKLEQNAEYSNKALEILLQLDTALEANFYFVWNQYKCMGFRRLATLDKRTATLSDQLYEKCYQMYYEKEKKQLQPIPQNQLDRDAVLVMTIQFLGGNHAPSKTVIERCKTLRKLGKKVYLVNTTEQYTMAGLIPFYEMMPGNVNSAFDHAQELELDGEKYPFLQLPQMMSMGERIQMMRKIIQEFKPYYLLSIGTGSMLADLCGNIVPCASMALVFSTLPHTMNRMKILGRKKRAGETFGKDDLIIESRFTFELKKQKGTMTRQEIGVPDDAFALVVVGIRLDHEVDDTFCRWASMILGGGVHIVFAGVFDTYAEVCGKYPQLGKYSSFIGYCNDMPALMEVCDLYVNPRRAGGGFSVIEAFEKGVPGVYLPDGDVAVAGGPEFCLQTYEETAEAIKRYREDREYYASQSQKARERARYMTDSVGAMREIDEMICDTIDTKLK